MISLIYYIDSSCMLQMIVLLLNCRAAGVVVVQTFRTLPPDLCHAECTIFDLIILISILYPSLFETDRARTTLATLKKRKKNL